MKANVFGKLLATMLIAIMVMALVACGSAESETTEEDTEDTTVEVAEAEELAEYTVMLQSVGFGEVCFYDESADESDVAGEEDGADEEVSDDADEGIDEGVDASADAEDADHENEVVATVTVCAGDTVAATVLAEDGYEVSGVNVYMASDAGYADDYIVEEYLVYTFTDEELDPVNADGVLTYEIGNVTNDEDEETYDESEAGADATEVDTDDTVIVAVTFAPAYDVPDGYTATNNANEYTDADGVVYTYDMASAEFVSDETEETTESVSADTGSTTNNSSASTSSENSTGGSASTSTTSSGSSESGSSSTSETTTTHKHDYTSTVTTKATCTAKGVITYTCSCGDNYTEIIAESEHDWIKTFSHKMWFCNACGEGFDNPDDCEDHALFVCFTGTHTENFYVLTCSVCGATK